MCGIAGLLVQGSHRPLLSVPMIFNRMRHRGPDDRGYVAYSPGAVRCGRVWNDIPDEHSEVLLLHRRLSILDLSEAGSQPMGTPDGRYYITFNGEIYNHVELRSELETKGYTFYSRSDTEVLLAAYAAWGANALHKFVGMFAFAILDTVRRVVFLARDCFGIKPLYYFRTQESFAFASELKALLDLGTVPRQINATRLFSYLRWGLCDFGGDTLLLGICQLPPAHYLELELDSTSAPTPRCYWQPSCHIRDDLTFDRAAQELQHLFLKNVSLHMRSDVALGSALSGGIDSSSIVMAMRHLNPEIDLHTFSYIADDEALNEEKWIDIVAAASNAHVHKIHATPGELMSEFEQLSYVQDLPSGSTSLYAQYCVFRAAQQSGIKVMLDGQGADEMLGGYPYFRGARLASLIRQAKWSEAQQFFARVSRWPGMSRVSLLQHACDHLFSPLMKASLRKLAGKDLVPPWLNRAWFQKHGVVPHLSRAGFSSRHVVHEKMCHELFEHLPTLLRYEDRNSMAFSIESRVPFLTPELVDFVLSLPEDYIIGSDGMSKAVFRRAMRGIVPKAVLERKDKIGFSTPERSWLSSSGSWVQQLFDHEVAADIPAFHLDIVNRDWDAMKKGRKPFSFEVWRCLNLISWTKRFGVQYS
jgi:asparagine synthase (glutamine-hydrolysing)